MCPHGRLVVVAALLLSCFQVVVETDAATLFIVPGNQSITCTDSLANVCTAPTSCNRFGKVKTDSGMNCNVGTATTINGTWTITGGYKFTFPSICNVTCQGNCSCVSCAQEQVADFITTAGSSHTSSANVVGIATLIRTALAASTVLFLILGTWSF